MSRTSLADGRPNLGVFVCDPATLADAERIDPDLVSLSAVAKVA